MTTKIKRSKSWVADPRHDGWWQVPVSDARNSWPKVDARVLDNTFYRYSDSQNRVVGFVTIMPDGLTVGWDTCGRCKQYFSHCTCKSGIYHPKTIGWMLHVATRPPDQQQTIAGSYDVFFDPWNEYDEKGIKKTSGKKGFVPAPKPTIAPFIPPVKPVARKKSVEYVEPELDINDSQAMNDAATVAADAKLAGLRKQLGTPKKRVRIIRKQVK